LLAPNKQEPTLPGAPATLDKHHAGLMLRETKNVRFQNQRNWSRMQVPFDFFSPFHDHIKSFLSLSKVLLLLLSLY